MSEKYSGVSQGEDGKLDFSEAMVLQDSSDESKRQATERQPGKYSGVQQGENGKLDFNEAMILKESEEEESSQVVENQPENSEENIAEAPIAPERYEEGLRGLESIIMAMDDEDNLRPFLVSVYDKIKDNPNASQAIIGSLITEIQELTKELDAPVSEDWMKIDVSSYYDAVNVLDRMIH